jgi:arabinan endo-1,5-alpha-L-arabinosidase
MHWLSALTLLSFATAGHAVVGPGVVTGNTAVHDPTMCKDNSGKYFVFCELLAIQGLKHRVTELASLATAVGLEIRTSPDRTTWSLVGKVWPNGAPWTDQYTGTSNG